MKPVYSDLEIAFRSFFQAPGFRQCTENEIIADAAKRAKNLAEISQKLSNLTIGSGLNSAENEAIEALHHLHDLLLKHHDPALKDNELFSDFIAQVLVFGILGLNIIINALSTEVGKLEKNLTLPVLLAVGLATSVDAMAAGVSLYFAKVQIFGAALFIGLTTFILSLVAFYLKRFFKKLPRQKMEIGAGVILILLGVKVLCEHLFWS